MALWLEVQWGNTYVPSLRIFAKSMSNTIPFSLHSSLWKIHVDAFCLESRADVLGMPLPAKASPVPPATMHRIKGWEQLLLQFPFSAQGSAGHSLGKEEDTLISAGAGEELGEERNKRQQQQCCALGKGSGARRMGVIKGKPGVHPKAPFLHLFVVRMTGGLQN